MVIYSMAKADVLLIDWNILEVNQPGDVKQSFFIGFSVNDGIGRLSTAILEYDPKSKTGSTRSGSAYTMEGKPGKPHPDAMYVLYHYWPKDYLDTELFSDNSTGTLTLKYPVNQ